MELISLNLDRETRSSLESPSVPLGSPVAWELLSGGGQSDAGELITPANSMQQSTVNACVQLLSTSIASMPLVLYEKAGAGKVEAIDHPLYRLLKIEPNVECTAHTLWAAFMASILLWGNGYIEVQRNGANEIQGLWFLPAPAVTPTRQSNGALVYRVSQGMTPGQFRVLNPKQIIHVPGNFSIDGVTGLSVVTSGRQTIGTMVAMDRFGGRFFANNATPSGILMAKAKFKPEDKDRARNDWNALQSGKNQHKIAVLDNDMTYQSISTPNSDAEWIASRRLGREEICGMFGVKTSQIGDTARVAGETYAAQQLEFLTGVLNPWVQKITQELTRKLLAGLPQYEIAADNSDRLKLDFKSQLDALAIARQWGIMTSREARTTLGLNPGPEECNQFWMPVNMIDPAAKKPDVTGGTENV